MAKKSSIPKRIETRLFGLLEEGGQGYFGKVAWRGNVVPLYIRNGKRDPRDLIDFAAPLALEQERWEKELRRYLKTQIEAGEASHLHLQGIEDDVLSTLQLSLLVATSIEGSNDLDLTFIFSSNHPVAAVPPEITDYEFCVNASLIEGIRSFEIRGGD